MSEQLLYDIGRMDDQSYDELLLDAVADNLWTVQSFIDERLEEAGCPMKVQLQIELAVEEIFVNIANYAYPSDEGMAKVCVALSDDKKTAHIVFVDNGIQYDPLSKEDPDVTLSAHDRPIGGLGIYVTKQLMDEVSYEYRDGCNILKLMKHIA